MQLQCAWLQESDNMMQLAWIRGLFVTVTTSHCVQPEVMEWLDQNACTKVCN
jgi:hypothetical protein